MLNFVTIIQHQGNYYRFRREGDGYICDVCYWKGSIQAVDEKSEAYTAILEQKYAPYDVIKSDQPFQSAESAMSWVATHLHKSAESEE